LTSTSNGDVYVIDGSGMGVRLYAGKTEPPRPFVVFNPSGHTFGVLADNTFTLYDAAGGQLGVLPPEPGMYKQVPSCQLLYSPEVPGKDPEAARVTNGRILDAAGTVKATFPADGLIFSRLTSTHILYATNTELVKSTFLGVEQWRTPVKMRLFEISGNGDRIIVNSAADSAVVYHYTENIKTGSDSLDEPVWNIAISPSGTYSAATSKKELHVYEAGLRQSRISLPVAYAVSLDVNDNGEVLVGGQDDDFTSHVLMYDPAGNLLWEETSVTDNNAWRPGVHFNPGGDTYVIRYKDGLKFYTITRRP
jgi:WD40 repeat protein